MFNGLSKICMLIEALILLVAVPKIIDSNPGIGLFEKHHHVLEGLKCDSGAAGYAC